MAGKSYRPKTRRDFNPESPLEGQGVPKDIRLAVTQVLYAFYRSDETLLPVRIDSKCRDRLVHEIKCLNRHKIGRVLKFSACRMDDTSGKTGWKKSNEGGREWREGTIRGRIQDCLIRLDTGETISERLIRDGFVTIVQSRRIRSDDRREDKSLYYDDTEKIICRSCGAEVERSSEITICPYCGAYIESDFYDWQLESFEIGKEGADVFKYIGILTAAVFMPLIISMLLSENWYAGLAPGFCIGIILALILIGAYMLLFKDYSKQIVRYSENTLRKNIVEYLWNQPCDKDLLERNLDEFSIRKVDNSEMETRITVKMHIKEQRYIPDGKLESKGKSEILTLTRARYPDRMKAKGVIFQEKECPACGANYVPDKNGNCSYCGYGLYVQNRNWKVEGKQK